MRILEAKPFFCLRGGLLAQLSDEKYEESNNLHKKMLHVSKKVHAALAAMKTDVAKAGVKAQKMLDALWAGQCNCAYWHGVFGGLYLPHLRQAIYKELLRAEQLADAALGGNKTATFQILEEDFDMDGQKECLVETPEQNLYFYLPHAAAAVFSNGT